MERLATSLAGRLAGGHGQEGQLALGVALFRRLDTPLPALLTLLDDDATSSRFRAVVARESTRPEILEQLRADRSERVRCAAQRDPAGGHGKTMPAP